jgi:hypothetical protein
MPLKSLDKGITTREKMLEQADQLSLLIYHTINLYPTQQVTTDAIKLLGKISIRIANFI